MTAAHDEFVAAMNSGAPIVDTIGDGRMEYDGPRCAADGCDTAVDNDNHPELCEECADRPHQFIHDGGYRDNFCVCGRIDGIAGYSPVHDLDGRDDR